MTKLFRFLKPYVGYILLIVIMVTGISLSSLFLPDRMSKIIGEGITSEVVFEETEDGQLIYLAVPEMNIEMPLPKMLYQDAGKLVTIEQNGKHYAQIIGLETDAQGNQIVFRNPQTGESMAVPQFLRTVDGKAQSQPMQGRLELYEGAPQLVYRQKSHMSVIWKNGLIMLGITLASSVLSIFVAYFSSKVGSEFGRDIRNRIFNKVVGLSKAEEDHFSTASLITRSTNDVTQVQMLVIMALRMMLNVPIMFVGGLVMALNKDAQMTLVLLASIPLVAVIILLAAKLIVPLFKTMQKRIDGLTMVARENITGVRVIKAFGGEDYEDNRFRQANEGVTTVSLRAARIMSVLIPAMILIMSLTSISIMFITAFSVDNALKENMLDYTRLGNMMAVIQYIMQIMMSVVMFSLIFIMVPRASVSAVRINEVLEAKNSISNPDNAVIPERNGRVDFENVSFTYAETSSQNALEGISFSAQKGSVTAIIGGTGSGKTTLVSLIPRLYDVSSGSVKIDGVDVRDMNLQDLRSRIGLVTQKAVLFSGTIKENVLYGATDEGQLQQALEIAQAAKIVEEKDGIDAEVEQGGQNFSGGQKQRISIARTLAKDADIIILDDSFSALDFATEAKLRKELAKATKHKTVIVVAQRIGTVMDADNILVLDRGRIVGTGKHKTLLETCPEYKDIALSQLSEKELGLAGGR